MIGGMDEKSVSLYSVLDDQWRDDLPQLARSRSGAAACIVKGFIYVVGGASMDNEGFYSETIERLDTRIGPQE